MEHMGAEVSLQYRIHFEELAWEAPMTGVRHRRLQRSGISGKALVFFVEPA